MAELKISPLKIFTEKFGRRMDFNLVLSVYVLFDAAVSSTCTACMQFIHALSDDSQGQRLASAI